MLRILVRISRIFTHVNVSVISTSTGFFISNTDIILSKRDLVISETCPFFNYFYSTDLMLQIYDSFYMFIYYSDFLKYFYTRNISSYLVFTRFTTFSDLFFIILRNYRYSVILIARISYSRLESGAYPFPFTNLFSYSNLSEYSSIYQSIFFISNLYQNLKKSILVTYLVTHCCSNMVINYFLISTSSSNPSLIYFFPSNIYLF